MAALDHWPSERRERRDPITGTLLEQLTAFPCHHQHLLGPDTPMTPTGEDLLFTADRTGGSFPNLFRLRMRTGVIEQLTDALSLDPRGITPAANGRQAIAGLRGDAGEVVAIDLETGEGESLAVFPEGEPDGCHRSASGEYVVTLVQYEAEATITAVHTEGMRIVPILTVPPGCSGARFSPDAKNSVLYVPPGGGAIRCVEFDGTADRELASGGRAVGRSGGIHRDRVPAKRVMDKQDGKSEAPGVDQNRYPVHPGHPVHPVNAGAGRERLDGCLPTWLGHGEQVLFVAGAPEGPLLAVPREGGAPRELARLPCRWARSDAAGERIMMETAAGLVLLEPRSGDVRPLVSICDEGARPCFSPDGRSVLYVDRDEAGWRQLMRAHLGDP